MFESRGGRFQFGKAGHGLFKNVGIGKSNIGVHLPFLAGMHGIHGIGFDRLQTNHIILERERKRTRQCEPNEFVTPHRPMLHIPQWLDSATARPPDTAGPDRNAHAAASVPGIEWYCGWPAGRVGVDAGGRPDDAAGSTPYAAWWSFLPNAAIAAMLGHRQRHNPRPMREFWRSVASSKASGGTIPPPPLQNK